MNGVCTQPVEILADLFLADRMTALPQLVIGLLSGQRSKSVKYLTPRTQSTGTARVAQLFLVASASPLAVGRT